MPVFSFVYFFRLRATALSLPSRVVVSRARKILLLKLLTWWGIAAKKQPFRLFFLAHRANTGSIPYLWESNKAVLNDDLNGRQIRRRPTSVERGDRFPSGSPLKQAQCACFFFCFLLALRAIRPFSPQSCSRFTRKIILASETPHLVGYRGEKTAI